MVRILYVKFFSVSIVQFDIVFVKVISWVESLKKNLFYWWALQCNQFRDNKEAIIAMMLVSGLLALNGCDLINHNKIGLLYPRTYKDLEITVKTRYH